MQCRAVQWRMGHRCAIVHGRCAWRKRISCGGSLIAQESAAPSSHGVASVARRLVSLLRMPLPRARAAASSPRRRPGGVGWAVRATARTAPRTHRRRRASPGGVCVSQRYDRGSDLPLRRDEGQESQRRVQLSGKGATPAPPQAAVAGRLCHWRGPTRAGALELWLDTLRVEDGAPSVCPAEVAGAPMWDAGPRPGLRDLGAEAGPRTQR